MTPDQQARERLAREATPGPWHTDTDANEQQMVLAVEADFWVALCPHQCLRSIEVQAEKNAKHIAANSPSVILADLARLRALEDAHEHLTRELALAHAEADAATERVQHLLTTIAVERTGRKEAEEEVARLRGALEEVRQAVSHPLMSRDVSADARAAILPTIDAALHAQDTDDEPRAICRHNIVADECGICDDLSRAAEVGR